MLSLQKPLGLPRRGGSNGPRFQRGRQTPNSKHQQAAQRLQRRARYGLRQRGGFGSFEDDRTPRCQRPCDLARRLAHREISGRKGHDYADGLMVNGKFMALRCGNGPAIGAHRFARVPFKKFRAKDDFKTSLRKRFAVFQCDGLCNFFLAFAQSGHRTQDCIAAHAGRGGAPYTKPLLCGI